MRQKQKVKGAHYTIDFFGCDGDQINSLKFWEKILPEAAAEGELDVLYSYIHKFDPQGLTGFLILSSSHISFHTWPEYSYVACDVFSCTNGDDTKKSVSFLKKNITHKRTETHRIKRGYVVMDYLTQPVYATGKNVHIKVTRKLADVKSHFQDIVIIDTPKYGRCMVIDKIMQTSEYDHDEYDNAITKKLKKSDSDILVLGGGDGYVAEMLLKKNPQTKITVVDLDREVVEVAKKHLNQNVFEHPNVNLVIGDAVTYMDALLETSGTRFDGIISDLTDNPIGGDVAKGEWNNFYKKIFSLSHKLLRSGGWLAVQAGASHVTRKYFDSAKFSSKLVVEEFGNVERNDVLIPSFSEKNAFIYAKATVTKE